jgi:hypothetical protein
MKNAQITSFLSAEFYRNDEVLETGASAKEKVSRSPVH